MTRSTDPSKNVSKIPLPKNKKKIHDKAVQSNILWLNLNKIGEISILQSAHKQGNASFHFLAPGLKRMHSNNLRCPKIFPLSALVLHWLSLLTCM